MFTARVIVQPTTAGRSDVVARLTREMTTVPEEFDGCQLFVVSEETQSPYRVLIAEEWDDRAAFERYTASDHFAEIMAHVGPQLAAAPDSAYYEGERVGP